MTEADLSTNIARFLPYVRRYGRALTGNQATGDAFAAATLEAIVEDGSILDRELPPKVAVFRAFQLVWRRSGAPVEIGDTALERAAQAHMAPLAPDHRQALLLNSIEEFTPTEIGAIMDIGVEAARDLVDRARSEIADSVAGKVLVVEDEAIIAMDIHAIVSDMGHRVTGIGRTREGAVQIGQSEQPDLILADIQLADNSSGIDAVNELLETVGDIPVVSITAFPERLLTGDRPEPAFVIAKPYTEDQVRSAVSQAMFFSSTETLEAG